MEHIKMGLSHALLSNDNVLSENGDVVYWIGTAQLRETGLN